MPNQPLVKTAANPEGRRAGSGTGKGAGRKALQATVECSGNCDDERVSRTEVGVVTMRLRGAREITLCPTCGARALAAVGITIEYPKPPVMIKPSDEADA